MDGYVEGRIRTEMTLSISATGRVSGEIYANKVVINGLHEGACHADSIEILEKGKAKGVIYTNDICIERGGCFLGQTHPADEEKVVTIDKEAAAKGESAPTENQKSAAPAPTPLKAAEAANTDKATPSGTVSAAGHKSGTASATTPVTDAKKQANARK
ncbi:polymer-forming cytoskeletal protein [Photobacterium sp. 1_MG-2023]|uniref:bactofilin family protein n=1 Tax=Photobacterium sp. 1_MG-2023 TaxID=3062646 RepID=UPI0026E467E4|nr:polymer-forming cytoskeletal protein [Photobacterium sp. 1_MG-2023]MDO6705501.1 polymer-forming cytoskeletal protein [Photobacterium sp. 1_MG-2023]